MQRCRGWLTLFLSLALWASLSTTLKAMSPPPYTDGDGSIADPFVIASKSDLMYFMNDGSVFGRSSHYIMVTDVDLTGETWVPVGTYMVPFTGSFNGDGSTISNLTLTNTASETSFYGLFGVCTDCKIMDLVLTDVDVDITSDDATVMVGALVGEVVATTHAMIFDITVSGTVHVSYTNTDTEINYDNLSVGGVVGRFISNSPSGAYDKITRVHSTVDTSVTVVDLASLTNYMTITIGGLVGYAKDVGLHENRIDAATIEIDFDPLTVTYDDLFTSSRVDVGGLVGYADQSNSDYGFDAEPFITLNRIGVTTPVTVNGFFNAGGLMGYIYAASRTNVTWNTLSNVTVNGERDVGGLVGEGSNTDFKFNTLTDITLSVADYFNTYTNANFGGLGGYLMGAPEVNDNRVSGLDTSDVLFAMGVGVGGMIGSAEDDTEMIRAVVTGSTIQGFSQVGGLIGSAVRPYLINVKVLDTSIKGNYTVGGLIGVTFGDTHIEESMVDVTIDADYVVGGLVGSSQTETLTIYRSFTLGSIQANQDVGGLIGLADSTNDIQDCYSRMAISYLYGTTPSALNGIAESIIGGIIGYDRGEAASLYQHLYFAGTITALGDVSPYVGPIIAASYTAIPVDLSDPAATYSSLFYDVTLYPGPNSTTLGIGLTTAQLMLASSYTGFGFASVWQIDALFNDGYAFLNEGFVVIVFINEPDTFGYQDFPGHLVTKPTDPTKPNFVFGGWFVDQLYTTAWNFETDLADDDVYLYAKWTAELPNTGEAAHAGLWIGSLAVGLWLISRKRKLY